MAKQIVLIAKSFRYLFLLYDPLNHGSHHRLSDFTPGTATKLL